MAVSLPRAEDMEAVPAWLELDVVPESAPAMWSSITSHLQRGDPDLLLARAQLLGLPATLVGESTGRAGVVRSQLGEATPRPDLTGLIVVDLSALWAGPLCGDLWPGPAPRWSRSSRRNGPMARWGARRSSTC